MDMNDLVRRQTQILDELRVEFGPQHFARCPSCDHLWTYHSEGGCWYSVTTAHVDTNVVCTCSVVRAEEPG